MPRTPVTNTSVERVSLDGRERAQDLVAVEEPLQIIVEHGQGHARDEVPLAITMRTPGHDRELVTGFLRGEGVITNADEVLGVRHCPRAETPQNVVRVSLREDVVVPQRLLERTLPMTSACGVCGERTVEALSAAGVAAIPLDGAKYLPTVVRDAASSLHASQACFRSTGGTHGAALFDREGGCIAIHEDVGRHNALDKLVGEWLSLQRVAANDGFVVVSSRASFELVQKTVRAGFPMMVAIGAPSSLAIATAQRFGLTLVGFAKATRFNVYSGFERIAAERKHPTFVEVRAAE